MREKIARDVVVNKYIEFLKDVQCYDVFEHTELSELIAKHGINKTVQIASKHESLFVKQETKQDLINMLRLLFQRVCINIIKAQQM